MRTKFILPMACLFAATLTAQTPDPLRQGFEHPPSTAKPRVWWHWMDGNVTERGIQLDLDWMQRVGIGGFTVFQGAIDTPQAVPHPLRYMTPEWKHAFDLAIATGKAKGFEMSIPGSPGWSQTGGPWVKPEEAMKKLVWSETHLDGGRPFHGNLPHPPGVTGTFQNSESFARGGKNQPLPRFYSDVAVVAYRTPPTDHNPKQPTITVSQGKVDASALSDGDVRNTALTLPSSDPAWVQFDYGSPTPIRAVTLATLDDLVNMFSPADPTPHALVESSDDGQTFRPVATITASSIAQRTVAFPTVTARYFRISFPKLRSNAHQISEIVLHQQPRLNAFEKRAGYATVLDYTTIPDVKVRPEEAVQPDQIVDLTTRMQPNGDLDWTPPAGSWTILRFGQSLIGSENEPAPPEATGLEVDKLNATFVRAYLDRYLKTYADAMGTSDLAKAGLTHFLTDSVEVGSMNWTDDMLDQFQRRRGYDARPWLPAMTGIIIRNTEDTNRFLWDFRATIAELFEQNHYQVIAEELHKRGLKYYGEALESHRPSLGDDMAMRAHADIPMGAMWTFPEKRGPLPTYVADLRGAASVAHLYGQNLVGAESMTAVPPDWTSSPNTLKRVADLEMILGVNLFEYHESAHQPLEGKAPGLTLGKYGQWFNRNETWAEQAGPWISYLARSSYLLQQGRFSADVAYFYGENEPLTGLFGDTIPTDTPHGYGFDFINRDVLLNRLHVENGRLVSTTGMSYRVLYLGGSSSRMTVPVLLKLEELVAQGAIIVGARPTDSPSLSNAQFEFNGVVDTLWGAAPPASPGIGPRVERPSSGVHQHGAGRVFFGSTVDDVLTQLHLEPDFKATSKAPVLFVHRKLPNGDLYFVDSRDDQPATVEASFRVTGTAPELWDPATGVTRPVSYRIVNGHTEVSLQLDPYGTTFVVFRKPTKVTSRQLPEPHEIELADLEHDWQLSFPADHGAPAEITLPTLASWSDYPNPGVKYFSGTATYSKSFHAPGDWLKAGKRIWLDLGAVKEIAEVELNGKPLPIAWKTPYRIDLTTALKSGENQLTIKVTNLWPNRIIGDLQPGATTKYTTTYIHAYDATSPLLPSGLIGPVRVIATQ